MKRFFGAGAGLSLGAAIAIACGSGGGSISITSTPPVPDAGLEAATPPPPILYSVGGTVTGLTAPGLVIEGTGAETLAVAADGPFTFATKLASGAAYGAFVQTQPQGETCTVMNGAGVIAHADITNVVVTCIAPTHELFVSDFIGAAIPVFDSAADGNVQPTRTIEGALTQLSHPRGLFVTETELFVADEIGAVLVFDREARADAAPLRALTGTNTGLHLPSTVFVDQGELFVADQTAVLKVWSVTDTGDVAPTRILSGPAMIEAAMIDDDELYVSSYGAGTVTVFPRDASGANVTATRTLTGFTVNGPTSLFINGDELFVSNTQARVDVVDKHTGTLLRSIDGSSTGLHSVDECTVVTGTLLCATYDAGKVLGFPLDANGGVPPTRNLSGNLTTLLGPRGIFLAP